MLPLLQLGIVAAEPVPVVTPALLFPFICSLLTVPADTLEPPAAIVAAVTRAIEGDSAAALESRWSTKLGRDSTDRSALFGLATLHRLRYAYPDAERLYQRVLGRDSLAADPLDAYSLLGLAQGLDAQGLNDKAKAAITRAGRGPPSGRPRGRG